MKTLTVYTVDELREKFPKAWERVLNTERQRNARDMFEQDDICTSFRKLFIVAGLPLEDWRIGYDSCDKSWCQVAIGTFGASPDDDDAGANMRGGRAIAWLENNLLTKLRAVKGDKYNKVGAVRSCPLTGVCYDDDFIEHVQARVKSGDTLRDAFESCAQLAGRLCAEATEYHCTEEYIIDNLRINERYFTSAGQSMSD
jgi:hypothetical protein